MKLRGSYAALVTPFDERGQVDYKKLSELVHFHLANATDGIVALGTTAETPTLTCNEKEKIVEHIISETDGKIPVIVGAGSNNTARSVELALKYQKMGADGLLLVSPYYNKANEEGMLRHFKTVADNVEIPIIIYNVPGRTGCEVPISVIERLSKHPNIAGIKEASGDIGYLMQCAKYVNEEFCLLSGNDDMIVPTLSVGGSGVISAWANICPKECHELVELYISGNREKALEIQLKYLELIKALFIEPNPIPIKTAMKIARYRLPLCQMSRENEKLLFEKMAEVGLC